MVGSEQQREPPASGRHDDPDEGAGAHPPAQGAREHGAHAGDVRGAEPVPHERLRRDGEGVEGEGGQAPD